MSGREEQARGSPRAPLDHVVLGGDVSGLAYAFWRRRQGRAVAVLAEGLERLDDEDALVGAETPHLDGLLGHLPAGPRVREGPATLGPPLLVTTAGTTPWRARSPLAVLARARRRGPQDGTRLETLSSFARRRFGEGILRSMIAPAARYRLGARPERLGAADAFPCLVAEPSPRRQWEMLHLELDPVLARRTRRLEGGERALAVHLAETLGATPIDDLTGVRIAPSVGDGVRALETGKGRAFFTREIVLALSGASAARLVRPHADGAAQLLDALPRAPLARVVVRLPIPGAWRAAPPPGLLVAGGAPVRTLGASLGARPLSSGGDEERDLVTLVMRYGGEVDPQLLELDDGQIAAVARADLMRALGRPVEVRTTRVVRDPRGIPLPRPGSRGRLAAMQAALLARGIRLLGRDVTGEDLDDRARPGAPPGASLPEGLLVT